MVIDLPNFTPVVEDAHKMEVDYSGECDSKIPHCKQLASKGKLTEAIEILLNLEKQTRTGSDMPSTSRVLVAIVQMCFDAKNWAALNENIILLTKRRSHIKQSISKMIEECCSYVDQISDKKTKLDLIDTLRQVTEGKIYVEVERARLTYKLAMMKEQEKDIETAATIMQELHVETYGSMERQEKVELILEQMRLLLENKDYIRTQIISKKISTRVFEAENLSDQMQDLKLKYYRLMIRLAEQDSNYLSICQYYRAMISTPKILNNEVERQSIMQNIVLYSILAPYDNESVKVIQTVLQDKILLEIPVYKELLSLFTSTELIRWAGLCSTFETMLKNGTVKSAPTGVFTPNSKLGETRWKDLKNRVVAHNIRVMAQYYTRISMKRMSELLSLPIQETEEVLSNMVVNHATVATTDRPAGIVNFGEKKGAGSILNCWSRNLNDLMAIINNATHLINKENMLNKLKN